MNVLTETNSLKYPNVIKKVCFRCDCLYVTYSVGGTLFNHIEVMVTTDTVIGIHRRSVDYYFLVAVIVVHVNVLWVTKS